MTIESKVFAELIDELENYYKRRLTPFVRKVWYRHLSQLSTEQFAAAVEQALVSKEFMPTPQELVEAVQGNSEVHALNEWDKCLHGAIRGQSGDDLQLSPRGKFALRAIGGLNRLGQSEESKHDWLRKDFVEAWKGWVPTPTSAALPPVPKQPALPLRESIDVSAELKDFSQKIGKLPPKKYELDIPLEDFQAQQRELAKSMLSSSPDTDNP